MYQRRLEEQVFGIRVAPAGTDGGVFFGLTGGNRCQLCSRLCENRVRRVQRVLVGAKLVLRRSATSNFRRQDVWLDQQFSAVLFDIVRSWW